jgi:Tol biopolymer transport system component
LRWRARAAAVVALLRTLIVYEANDGAGTNVFTIDPKTAVAVQLTEGAGFSDNPGWSPDRKQFVFASDRGNRTAGMTST